MTVGSPNVPAILSRRRLAPPTRGGARPGRILIVARELTRGGAAYLALRHARQLAAHYRVDVLVTGPSDPVILAEFAGSIRVYRLPDSDVAVDLGEPLVPVLERFASDHRHLPPFRRRYRAVLATSLFPDLAACLAVRTVRASRRLVFLVDESLGWYETLDPAGREVVDHCLRGADLVLPVSRRLWQKMAGRCPTLIERDWQVLRPPLDLEAIAAQADDPTYADAVADDHPVVLTVARLHPDKQIGLCIRVHRRLKEAGHRFRWNVIGSGPEEPWLRAGIADLGMEGEFLLLGNQEDVYRWMKGCDLFALFSATEGCPTVVLESLALGRPVIMTDVNGSDELIDEGRTGLVVANDPDAISEGLARLLEADGLRSQFRANLAGFAAGLEAEQNSGALLGLIEGPRSEGPSPAPRASIVIPTYNQEQFLDRTIRSALAQDLPSLEVIVVDDASTDGTGRVARRWDFDPRFRYVRNDRNLGRVANYRRGVTELARGDWVLLLDGDDFLADPGVLRRAFEAIDRQPDRPIVFAQAGHRVHDLTGARADVDVLPPIGGPDRVVSGGEYLQFVFETLFFTHLGALYRRDRAIAIGAYTAEISSSDMDFLLRLALEGDVLLLNSIAGYWVQHGSNTSANLPLDDLKVNVRIFRRIARLAVRRGLTTWDRIGRPLRGYEAMTLIHLFGTMVGKSARGPWAAIRFVGIGLAVHPGLFLDRDYRSTCLHFFRFLTRMAIERSGPGRRAWRGLQAIRARLGRAGSPVANP